MSRRIYLPVLDRRMVLRGACAAMLVSFTGCAANDETDPSQSDAGASGGTGSGSGSGSGGTPPTPLGPGVERCGAKVCLPLGDSANLALRTVERARVFDVDGKKLIVVRTSMTTFVTLSAICTHQGCAVVYQKATDDLECPCHGARFATDGAVKVGPANAPLAKYATSYDAASETVTITLG